MKRALIALLLTLMIVPGSIAAAGKKKRPKPEKIVPVTASIEMESEEQERDEREREERERERRPKRAKHVEPERKGRDVASNEEDSGELVPRPGPIKAGPPVELHLTKAASRKIDLRKLPQTRPTQVERPEREGPVPHPVAIEPDDRTLPPDITRPSVPERNAPAPAPVANFDGLDFQNWGNGHPPDTVGDVGPTYYIQSINTSLAIYRKSDNVRVAAMTYNTFMSQGNFGNLCDTNNFGDPVILYDTFEDRWVVTDFAFQLDGGGNVVNPPGAFQCIAVSMTNDPVTGGWNFYSINTAGGLGDYPKFGIWPDGLYMYASMFGYPSGASFITGRAYAFNKAQMYAGKPTVQVVSFDIPGGDFTVLPANARLQTGTPPAGAPNYYVSTFQYLNALTVYKFHVDWDKVTLSTFTGPDVPLAATSWPNANVALAPSLGGNSLDTLGIRAMMQNQYTNIGGAESLWTTHTVRRGSTTGFAAPRWYQVNVTGGTVNPSLPQGTTWDPDAADVMHRFMPSLAVDRAGNLAMGYSTSSSTTKPALKYAGRLAADPVNTFSQTEQLLVQGAGTQTGSCGGTCTRWGDYAAMSLDPDGCTFWFTSMYYAVDGLNHQTRIGSFAFPGCTPVGAGGTLSGTVTATTGGAPLSGVTVALGARSTTTNASGDYSFSGLPAGTYPLLTASLPGYDPKSVATIAVTDSGTTDQDFTLDSAPNNGCPTDTSLGDFQRGVPTTVDITVTPGSVKLANPPTIDQQNTTLGTQGAGFTTTTWLGQTFTQAITGPVARVDINFFSLNCSAVTMPNLTVSIRNATANLPTGADLATATIPGFCNGGGGWYTATFATPVTLTAGTQYALVWRAATAIPTGTPAPGYYGSVSAATGLPAVQNPYAGGRRASSSNSGSSWAGASGNANNDHGFRIYVDLGYSPLGTLISAVKDANPLATFTPIWSTIAWNGTAPANTQLRFQVAQSSNDAGPFNFIGPDGTASTYYTTSGASLSQFYGARYLKYKAYLESSSSTATPTLDDVTLCYTVADCTAAASVTPVEAQVCASSAGNSASGPAGAASYAWSIGNGTITSATNTQTVTYTAGTSGSVTLTLNIVEAAGCHKSGNAIIPIVSVATPTINAGGPTTFCSPGSVLLTSSSAGGNQWYLDGNPIGGATNQTYTATASGSYTVGVSLSGCNSSTSAPTVVTVNPTPAQPTINASGPTAFCDTSSVTLTSSSATGNQWYINNTLITGATNQTLLVDDDLIEAYFPTQITASFTVVATAGGCPSIASAATQVTAYTTPVTPVISAAGPTTFCAGGSVQLDSDNIIMAPQWYLNGNPISGATGDSYTATVSGTYTLISEVYAGCPSNASNSIVVTVNPAPPQPSITPSGPTTFCTGGSVTLTSSSASGNQWYLNGNPIGGETNQQYVATASGSYTVGVTVTGCTTTSAPTVVTADTTPATPTITPGGPTTFCAGGSVNLTSSSATGNQWYLNGNPIGGATNQVYNATANGSYTVVATAGSCSSAPSSATVVTVNPAPATPTVTPGGPTTFCTGGSVTLTSSSASGNQWYLNGNPIGGETNQQYVATANGSYTVVVTASGCSSAPSSATVVTVNPIPATPTITPGGPTTFCAGGSVSLTSSSTTGNQWYLNGNPIGGATNQVYNATANGSYTVVATAASCSSAPSSATVVTVNPIPATPTINAGGPTSFCAGGSVLLTSSSATGNQWRLNGNPIGGATNQTYTATASGDYTVVVTGSGCDSAASSTTTVTVNPIPNAAITAPANVAAGSTGNAASVANAGVGATYTWGITGGTITAGTGTANITFTAGAAGTLSLNVTVNTAASCSASQSANVNVTAVVSTVTVTNVSPANGSSLGGTHVTITGTGFLTGATVTFGGSAATNVVVGSATSITAKTPAHAAGAVNVVVTNADTTTGSLTNGYTYSQQNFDPNGDSMIDPSDIFYLVAYLFTNGPAPTGVAGMPSGDANGDGVVDPADIFYAVNYLFGGGAAPHSRTSDRVASTATAQPLQGALRLGNAIQRDGRFFVPVILTMDAGSRAPQALSVRVKFAGSVTDAAMRRGAAIDPMFEVSRRTDDAIAYLVAFSDEKPLALDGTRSAVIAEIEVSAAGAVRLDIDPALTMLVGGGAEEKATVANRKLRVSGTATSRVAPPTLSRDDQ